MKKYYIKLTEHERSQIIHSLMIRITHLWLKADTPTLLVKSS